MPRLEDNDVSINFMDLQLESKHDNHHRSLKQGRRPKFDGYESKHAGVAKVPEEVLCMGYGGSKEDNYFDDVVGALEEIIMNPMFSRIQEEFCRKHCSCFEDTEENKLEYTPIFEKYTQRIEGYLYDRLCDSIHNFDMDEFLVMCESRKHEIVGEVFDILLSCTDFAEFKQLMLSHKAAQEGTSPFISL